MWLSLDTLIAPPPFLALLSLNCEFSIIKSLYAKIAPPLSAEFPLNVQLSMNASFFTLMAPPYETCATSPLLELNTDFEMVAVFSHLMAPPSFSTEFFSKTDFSTITSPLEYIAPPEIFA